MQARRVLRQAKGTFITDEVHFMTAPGQFFAEAGGKNAASAHRRITGDADFHAAKSKSPCAPAGLGQRVEHDGIVGKQGDGMAAACAQSAQPRPGKLQLNIIARGDLRDMRLHR